MNTTLKIIASIIIWTIGFWFVTFQENRRMDFAKSPEGAAQFAQENQKRLIDACAEAAEKGVLGPGCTAMPERRNKQPDTIIVPHLFARQ